MRLAFHGFVLDAGARQLLAGGRPVKLTPKAFDVLLLLLERRPNVVRKDEIFERVWPETAAGDGPLTVVIAEIRAALGDDARSPLFVRTASRSGYAFCAAATELAGPAQARCWLAWEGRTYPLAEGENTVGRRPTCTVWVNASGVSRLHARIHVAGERATIEDTGSVNGILIGDAPVRSVQPLSDGDVLQLGSATLRFHVWSEAMSPPTERLPGRARRAPTTG
jgi:DNA-binding winged helix-turn-helix (wHTH) protein